MWLKIALVVAVTLLVSHAIGKLGERLGPFATVVAQIITTGIGILVIGTMLTTIQAADQPSPLEQYRHNISP